MPLSETIFIIMCLLTVAMVAAGVCRKLPVPDTVVLVIIGIVLGELAKSWEPIAPLHEFRLSPDLVFFIFLPALIFESGFNLDARQLIKELAPVMVLAVPALLLSTAFIGVALWLILGIDLILALLFGALVSATDPVAVIALFKELGAPLRLTVLVEGESLLNDATAIVVFGIVLSMAVGGHAASWGGVGFAALEFVKVFLGGALVGATIGVAGSELLYRLRSGLSGILTMSLVMAYVSFILAEHMLHVSGVMAAAAAAVALGGYGVTRMPHEATAAIGELWEVIALVCNSLLFLLVGLSVDVEVLGSRVGVIAVAVFLVMMARAATVYTFVPATTRFFSLPRVTLGERHIMWWGGLKGGLAIAIVLSIPGDLPGRQLIIDMTLGVVLFTLLVNAPTIRPLMTRLGLDKLTREEQAELSHGMGNAAKRAEATLEEFRSADLASNPSFHRVAGGLRKVLAADLPALAGEQETREAYLSALRTEQEQLRRLYDLSVIGQYTYLDLRGTLRRDRDAHSAAATDEVRMRARNKENLFLRIEKALLQRLREKDWAAGLLARYQDTRLAHHLQQNFAGIIMCEVVLEALATREGLSESERKSIAEDYEARLRRRRERVETIRREYPAFFQRFESLLCTRVALTSAMQGAQQEFHHGEIGAKAFTQIERRIQSALAALPPISEPLPKLTPRELIEMVPLLAGLSEQALAALAERARPVTFLAGDVVIGEGQKGDALYIITHGRVAVHRRSGAGEDTHLAYLGEGEFFGEAALLGDPIRTATVTAHAPTTLLRLSRRDVLDLASASPEMKRRLEEAHRARAQPTR